MATTATIKFGNVFEARVDIAGELRTYRFLVEDGTHESAHACISRLIREDTGEFKSWALREFRAVMQAVRLPEAGVLADEEAAPIVEDQAETAEPAGRPDVRDITISPLTGLPLKLDDAIEYVAMERAAPSRDIMSMTNDEWREWKRDRELRERALAHWVMHERVIPMIESQGLDCPATIGNIAAALEASGVPRSVAHSDHAIDAALHRLDAMRR